MELIVIVGAGGHAASVANVALSAGFRVAYFIDAKKTGQRLMGVEIVGDLAAIANPEQYGFAVAIGDNAVREAVADDIVCRYPSARFPKLVHASAVISIFTEIGEGTVLMPNAVVGPNSRVGRFCILNTQAAIDHDCAMADYASMAPGAITGGGVNIGARSAVSIGAVVKHGITVGDDCVIGANSYLSKNISSNVLAYGSPAQVIRSRLKGEAYLK
jgi:sugar O-acyltransferase (sialic acid O-acetyltransferase NeuD family)